MTPNCYRFAVVTGLAALMTAAGSALSACSSDPFERYARTIYRDVDGSSQSLSGTVARLQLMVVHGHMPVDKGAKLTEVLGRAEKDLQLKSADFSHVTPPDSDLNDIHRGLSQELQLQADSVSAVASAVAACARPAKSSPSRAAGGSGVRDSGMDSTTAAAVRQAAYEDSLAAVASAEACRATLAGALVNLSNSVDYTRDLLRWGRQRAARKLATHGVLLRPANDLPS